MEVVRSVFSRIIVLLAALGQNIIRHTIGDKYMTNIAIVSILYGMSLMIEIIIYHLQDIYQMSTPIVMIGQLPNFFMNFVIFMWILMAFR